MSFSDKVIIKGVTCFGKWDLMEGGCFVAGHETETEEPFENFFDGNDCTTWTQVVNELTDWGQRVGITIEELVSDNPNN